jgi:hypothetical protein
MAIEAVAEYGDPDRELTDPVVQAQERAKADAVLRTRATATIVSLLEEHPAAIREIKEMLRSRVYVKELTARSDAAKRVAAEAELRESALMIKLDPGGRRVLGFGLGAALVVALMILDAVPLNWAAQAFGLDPAGTLLVTLILVAASTGAMLGFELSRLNPRRRGALTAAVTTGYLALLGLRTEFLTTVASDPLLIAFLQSALLTAISVGLVWCGSAILGRTRSLGHSRARAGVRRAARVAGEARAAQFQAVERLARHVGSLHHMLYPWALGSAAPDGVDHAEWSAALDEAIQVLFPAA